MSPNVAEKSRISKLSILQESFTLPVKWKGAIDALLACLNADGFADINPIDAITIVA